MQRACDRPNRPRCRVRRTPWSADMDETDNWVNTWRRCPTAPQQTMRWKSGGKRPMVPSRFCNSAALLATAHTEITPHTHRAPKPGAAAAALVGYGCMRLTVLQEASQWNTGVLHGLGCRQPVTLDE